MATGRNSVCKSFQATSGKIAKRGTLNLPSERIFDEIASGWTLPKLTMLLAE